MIETDPIEPRKNASPIPWKDVRGTYSLWSAETFSNLTGPVFAESVVALGTFDGVHKGHRHILQKACTIGREKDLPSVAFTFDRHPAQTLAPDKTPPLLNSFSQRLQKIGAIGIDHVIVAVFDEAFAGMSPEDFIQKVLCQAFNAREVVAGYNFRFGQGARGNAETLAKYQRDGQFSLRIVQPIMDDQTGRISSTRIREFLQQGQLDQANRLLAQPFAIEGTVVSGDARGRALGFPTANLSPADHQLVPKDGVYITEVAISETSKPAARKSMGELGVFPLPRAEVKSKAKALTAIGTRPSFGTSERTVESFLLDFEGDLYGKSLEIAFLKRVRDIVRFESPDALKEQISKDVKAAKDYFDQDRTFEAWT